MLCPILRAKAPPRIKSFRKLPFSRPVLFFTPVFSIKKNNIHTYFKRVYFHDSGYLEQNTYTAGSIIGSIKGCIWFFFVFISKRAGVPVCCEQNSFRFFRRKAAMIFRKFNF